MKERRQGGEGGKERERGSMEGFADVKCAVLLLDRRDCDEGVLNANRMFVYHGVSARRLIWVHCAPAQLAQNAVGQVLFQ